MKAGLSESAVRDVLNRGSSPSIDAFLAICGAAGVSPSHVLEGGEFQLSVPIVGIVSAGEGWTEADPSSSPVEFALAADDTIAIEVKGDSMAPVYRNGDLLFCNRRFGPHADNLIGLDCVIKTADGRNFLKILKRGSRPGRFALKSYNVVVEDIEDVALAWAAPVAWIKRVQR